MSKVECGHRSFSPLGTCDDRRIGYAKRHVVIALDEFPNSSPIVKSTIELVRAPFDVSRESGYGYRTEVAFDEMGNLREYRDWDDERTDVWSECVQNRAVLVLTSVKRSKECGCVEDYQSGFQFSAFHSSNLSAGIRPPSATPKDSGQSGASSSGSV